MSLLERETEYAMTVAGRSPDAEELAAAGLRLDVAGGVATLTLDRPDRRNAQSPAMWQALAALGRSLAGDVRVVVVRGEGSAFSAGLDLRMVEPGGVPGEGSLADLAAEDDARVERFIAEAQEAFTWLRRPDIVSVAAVQGHAIGAGFQLALACDLRVLADDARLAMKEPAMGLVPDLGGTKPLVDGVGLSRALEICLTGRVVESAEAARLGLAELVVPGEELRGAVEDLVAALLETPHDAAAATKALLHGATRSSLDEQLAAERRTQVGRLRALFGAA